MRRALTVERLKEVLHYNPDTGIFTWLRLPKNTANRKVGDVAGGRNSKLGYVTISIDSVSYGAHRLAWLYIHGYMPNVIDHDDGDPSNNKAVNLIDGNARDNAQNRKEHRNGKLPGVIVRKSGRFRARIEINGVRQSIGEYDTKEEAHEAYLKAVDSHEKGEPIQLKRTETKGYHKKKGKDYYEVYVRVSRTKRQYVGSRKTEEEAAQLYKEKKLELLGDTDV
jgi:hypothetical protein